MDRQKPECSEQTATSEPSNSTPQLFFTFSHFLAHRLASAWINWHGPGLCHETPSHKNVSTSPCSKFSQWHQRRLQIKRKYEAGAPFPVRNACVTVEVHPEEHLVSHGCCMRICQQFLCLFGTKQPFFRVIIKRQLSILTLGCGSLSIVRRCLGHLKGDDIIPASCIAGCG